MAEKRVVEYTIITVDWYSGEQGRYYEPFERVWKGFIARVNGALCTGWTLHGPTVIQHEPLPDTGYETVYMYQPIVKYAIEDI